MQSLTLSLSSAVQNKRGWFFYGCGGPGPRADVAGVCRWTHPQVHPFPPHAPLLLHCCCCSNTFIGSAGTAADTDGQIDTGGTGTTQQREWIRPRHGRIQMEPRQQHGGLGPRLGLRSPMGDVPSCHNRQAPWGLGQDSRSSRAVAQQGVEDPREPLCSTGQAMCPSPPGHHTGVTVPPRDHTALGWVEGGWDLKHFPALAQGAGDGPTSGPM